MCAGLSRARLVACRSSCIGPRSSRLWMPHAPLRLGCSPCRELSYADRSEFNTHLREKNRAGAQAVDRPVNPRLILSEGQLAANGFSILCSASVYYPWSRWRALLLDDPLQHNDVIHAAAFSDVMRNLVEMQGYQVMMSSHDRAETEYLERKFTAARLPCTVVQLTSDSPMGVTYEARNNAAASEALRAAELRVG